MLKTWMARAALLAIFLFSAINIVLAVVAGGVYGDGSGLDWVTAADRPFLFWRTLIISAICLAGTIFFGTAMIEERAGLDRYFRRRAAMPPTEPESRRNPPPVSEQLRDPERR